MIRVALVALFLSAGVAFADPCADLRPTGDPLTWLKKYQTQAELEQIFLCAARPASETIQIPVGLGRGYGSLYNEKWPAVNSLQNALGSLLWGGKRFHKVGSKIQLVNLMKDTGKERYRADVFVAPSIKDGKSAIILDYRQDDSRKEFGRPGSPLQHLVDIIGPGIRDEIREIYQDNKPTGVYVGRANLYSTLLSPTAWLTEEFGFPIEDQDFGVASNWFFAANFFLDFRGNLNK